MVHVIAGVWDPREAALAVLNKETAPEVSSVFLTIAADLVNMFNLDLIKKIYSNHLNTEHLNTGLFKVRFSNGTT